MKCVFCGNQTRFTIVPKGGGIADSYPAHKKCNREYHSKKTEPQRVYAEGNKGGDYFDITMLENDTVRLKVGHTCLTYIDAVVPIEFITAALARAVWDNDDPRVFIKNIGWPEEFTISLIKKVISK